jgi:hypothetical protein
MKFTIQTTKTNTALCGLLSGLLLLAAGTFTAQAAGPVSEYYLTAGSPSSRLVAVQGGSIVFDNAMAPTSQQQYPIAVGSTVRTLGYNATYTGGEYTLAGVPTGATYAYPGVPTGMYDGTTDGTFNYAWNFDTGAAYRFSTTWTSPTVIFTLGVGSGRRLGITYDGTNNSLWLSGWDGAVGQTIENRTLAGGLISSFTVAHDENVALALDPADNTLWLNDRNQLGGQVRLEQYTKAGALLQTVNLGGAQAGYNVLGGEFALVPEPGSALLLAGGGLGLLLRRRRAAV